jgi:hypothetical protein
MDASQRSSRRSLSEKHSVTDSLVSQFAAREQYRGLEQQTEKRVRMPRSISAESLGKPFPRQAEQATAAVRLFLCGQPKWRITVPEQISKEDLGREVSKMFHGRVSVVPETYPLKVDTVVDCVPSFVGPSAILD